MKVSKILSILLLTVFISSPVFALRSINFGNYWERKYRSIIQEPIPFESFYDDSNNTIVFNFLKNIKGLTIKVTDQNGKIICNEVFNVSQNENENISLGDIVHGNYTVLVYDDIHYAKGQFEVSK